MSIKSEWLRRIPGEGFIGAVSFLNSLDWNIEITESKNQKKVITGDRLLFSSNNEKEIESFIFGMAIGLAVLPEEVLNHVRKIIKE